MKIFFISMAAIAATLCTISCNKDIAPEVTPQKPVIEQPDDMAAINVHIEGTALTTKTTDIAAADEAVINDVQILVFRGDDLDGYKKYIPETAGSQVETVVNCTMGSRSIYVLVNAPDLSTVLSETTLNATISNLSDNEKGKFVMMDAKTDITVSATNDLTFSVKRLAAKISIKKITNRLSSPALAAMDFRIDEIFLINVAKDWNYGQTRKPSGYYNLGNYIASDFPGLTYDAVNEIVAFGTSYSETHTFYCYRNILSETPTRLVVKATLWDDADNDDEIDEGENPEKSYTYYYPITISSVESNTSYEISELIITRPGADIPDTVMEFSDGDFTFTASDWTVVPVVDEGNQFVQI